MAETMLDIEVALERLKRLVALGIAATTPIVVGFAGVAPPWPPSAANLTAITVAFLVALAWPLLENSTDCRRRRVFIGSATLFVFFFLLYLAAFRTFVSSVPTQRELVITVGCGFTEYAQRIMHDRAQAPSFGCPGDYSELLADAQYEVTRVWTRQSLTIVQVGIFAVWLMTITSMAIGFFGIVMKSSRRTDQGNTLPHS